MRLKRVGLSQKAERKLHKHSEEYKDGYYAGFVEGRDTQLKADKTQFEQLTTPSRSNNEEV